MAEAATSIESKRYAIVTGSNKGIGFEIVRQLVSNGVTVVLTARDEKKGIEAVEILKNCGLSDFVVFHQPLHLLLLLLLTLSKPDLGGLISWFSLSLSLCVCVCVFCMKYMELLQVNNAGISGMAPGASTGGSNARKEWHDTAIKTYDLAKECLETNYYGTKRMVEAFVSLLQLSHSPRIVNVSSSLGKLENKCGEWAKQVLGDSESLTEEKIDGLLDEFLKDFKDGCIETKGWPSSLSAYRLSKAAVNAYARVIAKKYPGLKINCVCPGYVKTELNHNSGVLTVEEGAASPVKLALGPSDGTSGLYFIRDKLSSF